MDFNDLETALVFKAFCDENRLSILRQLRGGEKCACVLLEKLDIAQSTLSHHMKILCDSGIVTGRQAGKWTNYSLSAEGCARAESLLGEITAPAAEQAAGGTCACR
jgi:ArsR family transcriptional regulator